MLKHRSYHPVLKVRQREAASSFRLLSELHGCHLGVTKDAKGGESLGSSDFLMGPVLSQATPGQFLLMGHDGGRCLLKLQMYVALFQAIQQSNLNVWGCWVPTFSRCCTLSARQTTLKYPEKPRVLLLDAGDLNSGWKTLLNRHATIKVLPPFVLRKQSQEHTLLLHG
jgi:hypothetical protein